MSGEPPPRYARDAAPAGRREQAVTGAPAPEPPRDRPIGSRITPGAAPARRRRDRMDHTGIARRSLLQAIAATLATAAMPVGWAEVAQALEVAPLTAGNGVGALSFLSANEAADVEAVTAQIVPT